MGKPAIAFFMVIFVSCVLFVLVLTKGCPFFVQSVGRFYPERGSLEKEGSFQPSISFFEATGVGEEKRGINFPTIVCPKDSYAANSVRVNVADVTGTKGYDRFKSVFFTFFKIEYKSGSVTTLISPVSPTREFDVCDGAYADCGMDMRHMPEAYRLKAKEDVVVMVKGFSVSNNGERESFTYRQKWVYDEDLIVKSFSDALP
jgi:hypothetical protein